jgi:thioredoxin 1
MQLKKIGTWLLLLIIVGAVFGWKNWQQSATSKLVASAAISGPTVILFRGDNDPGCQSIYQLVDEAAARQVKGIRFIQQDWSDNNPLIKKYQIRFLPSVVFIDQDDKERLRIVGESPAVQKKLKHILIHLDELFAR